MVFYAYAIFCSQVYLDEFYGALFTVNRSDRRARIPIVKDFKFFLQLAELGEKIAELEKIGANPDNVLRFDYESIIESLPPGFHLEHGRSQTKNPFDAEKEILILRDEKSDKTIEINCPVEIQNFTVSGYAVVKDCWLKFPTEKPVKKHRISTPS